MKHLLGFAVVAALAPVAASAAPVTFAQYTEVNPSSGIGWTVNDGTSAQLVSVGRDSVSFSYGTFPSVSSLPSSLQGPQAATLAISGGTTTAPAFVPSGTDFDVQPINSPITLTFTRATPYDGLSNLLTVTIGASAAHPVSLIGTDGGESAAFSAASNRVPVSFTSDFLTFPTLASSDAAISLSAIKPSFTYNPATDTFVESFVTDSVGTFSADPGPNAVPAPGGPLVLALGIAGLAAARARFVR